MRCKLCEVMQQEQYINIDKLKEGLQRPAVRDYAYIWHDKDTDKMGSVKTKHIHIAIRLKNSYDSKYIADWFGVPEQYVNRVKGKWQDMLKYLTHKNAPEEYQYDESEVISNFNWIVERDKKTDKEVLNEIINRIDNFEIKEYELTKEIPIDVFSKNRRMIENAIYFSKMRWLDMNKDRHINIIFITGLTGTGKTRFAKYWCNSQNKSYCISSNSNDPMQDYRGEDVLILDDLRDDAFKFADLLKILDKHTTSTIKSRYNNKLFYGDTIIITSHKDITYWYNEDMPGQHKVGLTAKKQLFRRCSTRLVFTDDKVTEYRWNKDFEEYQLNSVINNVWSADIKSACKNTISMFEGLLGKDGIKYLTDKIDNADDKTLKELKAERDNIIDNPFDF